MTVVAAFYYLRVIWFIYFEKTNQEIGQPESTILQKAVVSFTGIAILLIGLYPKPILDFCRQIISSNLLLD
jgi:NADH-quinone oxidoreductase subunit N